VFEAPKGALGFDGGVGAVLMMSGLTGVVVGGRLPMPSTPWWENEGCESLVGVIASAGSLLVSSSSSSGIGTLWSSGC